MDPSLTRETYWSVEKSGEFNTTFTGFILQEITRDDEIVWEFPIRIFFSLVMVLDNGTSVGGLFILAEESGEATYFISQVQPSLNPSHLVFSLSSLIISAILIRIGLYYLKKKSNNK